MMTVLRRHVRDLVGDRDVDDGGNAIIEFIFVAVLVLVPLVYVVVAVAVVQRSELATTSAARDVGRAVASSDDAPGAADRARAALQISLSSHGLSVSDVALRYVDPGSSCEGGASVEPALTPGAIFAVCVIRHQRLPAVPTVLSGKGITTIGRYVVHVDEFRTIAP